MAMVKFANEKECSKALMEAIKSGDEAKMQKAWEDFHKAVVEQVKADSEELMQSNDAAILAQRGYRQLTHKETKWYEKFIEALKSNNPKQAVIDLIGTDNEEDFMPTTIIEDTHFLRKSTSSMLVISQSGC